MSRRRKREPNLKKRAVLYFTAFVLFILSVVFLFQLVLIDTFYRRVKIREINEITSSLITAVGSEQLTATADSLSVKYRTCILVLSTGGKSRSIVAKAHGYPDCVIHKMRDEEFEQLYAEAKGSGSVTKTVPKKLPKEGGFEQVAPQDAVKSIIRAGVFTDDDGNEYALFIDAQLTPLNSSVAALRYQFSWTTLAVLLIAAFAAYIFADKISKPLSRINDTAKKMASGDLSVSFPVEGYLETKELAGTLNYAVGEIARSDRLQRELIANVSHDLRTPLTMIAGYAEILRDIPGENTPENLQVIIDETKHLSELVNDMLDLSRIEAGVKKPEFAEFDLTGTVREVLERYSALTVHDGYEITFDDSPGTAFVSADRSMIIQVIYNLVNNAINYTGDDKLVFVTEEFRKNGEGKDAVRITVRDTGAGIDPEHIHEIWDRYYKVDKDHKRAAKGTGIGLSIVKHILQAHAADFGVESSKSVGSSFWFELPLLKTLD